MKRTFQGKITPGMILAFLLFLGSAFFLAWNKNVYAIFLLFLVILSLERMLHTAFIINSQGNLRITKGRFSKDVVVDIAQVLRVEKGESLYTRLGLFSYLNIIMKDGREISVWPADEQGFLDYLKKKHEQTTTHDEEE